MPATEIARQPQQAEAMEMPAAPEKAYSRTSAEQPRPAEKMIAEQPVSMRGGGGGEVCCGLCAGLACFECLECCC